MPAATSSLLFARRRKKYSNKTYVKNDDESTSPTMYRRIEALAIVVMRYIPPVNIVYDLFFDEPPSITDTKDLLNLIGLIAALMISFVVTVMTAISHQDLVDADTRFMQASANPATNGYHILYEAGTAEMQKGLAPSAWFAYNCYLSLTLLLAGLLFTLTTYVSMMNKKFDAETPSRTVQLFHAWWFYARWVMIFAFVTTVWGLVVGVEVADLALYILFPDYMVERYGRLRFTINSPYAYSTYLLALNAYLLPTGVLFLGLSTASRYWVESNQHTAMDRVLATDLHRNSRAAWEALLNSSDTVHELFDGYAEEYVDIFTSHSILFEDRVGLTDTQLFEMGIKLTGHRVRLLILFKQPYNASLHYSHVNDCASSEKSIRPTSETCAAVCGSANTAEYAEGDAKQASSIYSSTESDTRKIVPEN